MVELRTRLFGPFETLLDETPLPRLYEQRLVTGSWGRIAVPDAEVAAWEAQDADNE